MVICFMCGAKFEPRPEKLKEWAESGRDFDPTDWGCKSCYSLTPLAPDAGDSEASSELVQASALSTSQAEPTPTQRG